MRPHQLLTSRRLGNLKVALPQARCFHCRIMPRFPSRLCWILAALVWALGASLASLSAMAAPLYTGTSLAGGDFGEAVLPGSYNTNYTYPTTPEVDYFLGKGANTFRLPFRWERMQPTLNSALDATELSRMDTIVNYATSHGAYVLLDPHNYARYWIGGRPGGTEAIVGSAQLPNSTLADLWTRLANQYKNNSHVMFGLMNEPNNMSTEQWAGGAQAAINAIRATVREQPDLGARQRLERRRELVRQLVWHPQCASDALDHGPGWKLCL